MGDVWCVVLVCGVLEPLGSLLISTQLASGGLLLGCECVSKVAPQVLETCRKQPLVLHGPFYRLYDTFLGVTVFITFTDKCFPME